MKWFDNCDISSLFTWKVRARARAVAFLNREEDVVELRNNRRFAEATKRQIIGQGSNTLFTTSFYDGLVIVVQIRGVELVEEDALSATFQVGAGENWHDTVRRFVFDFRVAGMENMAYIPGTFGAAPVQNVGAYGQSLSDVMVKLDGFDLATGEKRTLKKEECAFAYRDSVFKHQLKGRFLITSVTVRLKKPQVHEPNVDYHSNYERLYTELQAFGEPPYSPQQVFQAVTSLRKKKLPDIADVGTNGSVFTNPIVTGWKLKELLKRFPNLQYYPSDGMSYPEKEKIPLVDDGYYKIAAGHIFDELGWRGKRIGDVGTWPKHALVLCNFGTSDPSQIVEFITHMQTDFRNATGILLEPEINIVN
jgi:UDP-N-acetylmuramate dehydrogenase